MLDHCVAASVALQPKSLFIFYGVCVFTSSDMLISAYIEVTILLMLMQLHKYAFYCSTIMAQSQNFSNAQGKRLNPLLSPNTITRTWMGLQKFNE